MSLIYVSRSDFILIDTKLLFIGLLKLIKSAAASLLLQMLLVNRQIQFFFIIKRFLSELRPLTYYEVNVLIYLNAQIMK